MTISVETLAKRGSLAEKCPELVKEWHPKLNGKLKPEDVTAGSSQNAWWLCDKGHEWQARISHRSNGIGCPTCSGRQVPLNPELVKEWHPTLNGELKPEDVTAGSGKKVWWLCKKNPSHFWPAKINNRSRGYGCSQCSLWGTSKIEQLFFKVAAKYMTNVNMGADARIIPSNGGRSLAVDVIGERNGHKVALEYDGVHWHSYPDSEQKDLRKTCALLNHRFLVIRIRESFRDKTLGNLPLSHPNLLQLSFEYSLDSEKAKETLSKAMEWVDAHD